MLALVAVLLPLNATEAAGPKGCQAASTAPTSCSFKSGTGSIEIVAAGGYWNVNFYYPATHSYYLCAFGDFGAEVANCFVGKGSTVYVYSEQGVVIARDVSPAL
jgi:hypothetical protein